MRPIEIFLLMTVITWLTAAGWPRLRPAARSLALLAVVFAVLQVVLEGWRWQVVPLYLVAIAAAAYAARNRTPGRALVAVLAVPTLSAAFLMWALPVFRTPPLTGPHPVGVMHDHWVDAQRQEPRRVPPGPREIALSVWYPAAPDSTAPRAPWIPDFVALRGEYANKLGWPAWMADYLRYGHGQARAGARPAAGRYPLVLYSHGLNRNRFESVSRMEALASHGHVVVAVDHPYGADFVRFPDGRIERFVNKREAADSLAEIDQKRLERLAIWVADLRFVLDRIAVSTEPPWNRVDPERVAAVGFSNGGSAALLLAAGDPRVDAAVDLDGTPRGAVVDAVMDRPLLLMESEPPAFSDEDLARWQISREELMAPSEQMWQRMDRIRDRASAPTWRFRLRGAQHSNFSDAPMISPLSAQLGIGGSIDSHLAAAAIDACLLAFLDFALHRDAQAETVDRACERPELMPVQD